MNKWIQKATVKSHEGALHRQLGIPTTKKIPEGLLKEATKAKIGTHVRGHTVTPLLKRRALFAYNIRR